MRKAFSAFKTVVTRLRAALAIGTLLAATALGGCKNTTEALPDPGRGYYPLAVGNTWTYAVRDSVWSAANQTTPTSTPTATTFQFRETITEMFTDAAGQPAYRLVRARRATATDNWVDDSVFTISSPGSALVLNRGNTRTVELIFPPRAGRSWNLNAFNNNYNDTITAETRQYSAVGQPFTTGGGNTGLPAVAYSNTITTANTGMATESSLLRHVNYQQVYAQGVGPVYRRRDNKASFTYTSSLPPYNQIFPPGAYTSAFTRRETLIDYKVK
ncbi:hypothetical protein MON38_09125 [Hymenobacter sp. DH14]|uniref:DUF5007 domain-containing protein n=1 Tax=Hymenobacter cyanobacteriorum TaxID=2926463 RepID=A0A9X1VIG6_9BACT|nr:hypothetical protein [Hymenobacter cyanobacteriorum]MCI1187580.1 hypothetical protein [Hymenobacter cyanobacteriorum]